MAKKGDNGDSNPSSGGFRGLGKNNKKQAGHELKIVPSMSKMYQTLSWGMHERYYLMI